MEVSSLFVKVNLNFFWYVWCEVNVLFVMNLFSN